MLTALRGGRHEEHEPVAPGIPAAGRSAVTVTALGPAVVDGAVEAASGGALPLRLEPESRFGGLGEGGGTAPLPGAEWYTAESPDAGLAYRCPVGALAEARFLTADLLVDSIDLAVFRLELL
jgi:hypothetical protein